MGGNDVHSLSNSPASTIKVCNVMQWFRRSGVKPDVEDMSTVGNVSTSTIGKVRNSEQPKQMHPAHGDTTFSFSRAGWWFTTSSLVVSASAAFAATGAASTGSAAAKDVLRIHHGAVGTSPFAKPRTAFTTICLTKGRKAATTIFLWMTQARLKKAAMRVRASGELEMGDIDPACSERLINDGLGDEMEYSYSGLDQVLEDKEASEVSGDEDALGPEDGENPVDGLEYADL